MSVLRPDDDLEEWIRQRLDTENLTPGKYYPPDESVVEVYRADRAANPTELSRAVAKMRAAAKL